MRRSTGEHFRGPGIECNRVHLAHANASSFRTASIHGRRPGTFRVQRPFRRTVFYRMKTFTRQGDVVLLFACCSLLPCPAVQMRKMNHAHRTDKHYLLASDFDQTLSFNDSGTSE